MSFAMVMCLSDIYTRSPNSERASWTYHALPPPPPLHPSHPCPQEPTTMGPKCIFWHPEHNLTCSLDSYWNVLELQPLLCAAHLHII